MLFGAEQGSLAGRAGGGTLFGANQGSLARRAADGRARGAAQRDWCTARANASVVKGLTNHFSPRSTASSTLSVGACPLERMILWWGTAD